VDSPSPEPLPQPKFRLLEGGQRLPRLPRVWTGLWVAAGVLGAAALVMAVLMALDATASARGLALSFASWFLFAGVALLTFAGGMRLVLPWGVWGLRVMLGFAGAVSLGAGTDGAGGLALALVSALWIGLSFPAAPRVRFQG
jgi:hypothetical protein